MILPGPTQPSGKTAETLEGQKSQAVKLVRKDGKRGASECRGGDLYPKLTLST